jgi:hypothetical protein
MRNATHLSDTRLWEDIMGAKQWKLGVLFEMPAETLRNGGMQEPTPHFRLLLALLESRGMSDREM